MKLHWIIILLVFVSSSLFANEKASPLSNQTCIDCHSEEAKQWQLSDHAKAMAVANDKSVLANFADQTVEHYGQKAYFFIKDNSYQVTISYAQNTETFVIKYSFGHYPLQQYIVETAPGRLQILPFAWNSRKKAEGGQRWYHNYSHEEIRPEDRLHWRQPLQNWNGMCADCHSDGLKRNYDSEKNKFNSQFDNINIGCLSCHGDLSAHAKKQSSGHVATSVERDSIRNVVSDIVSTKHPTGQWLRSVGQNTASWHSDKNGSFRDNQFMDTCFACHSLRAPLNDGIDPKKRFLDQFTPQLLLSPNYHADGQIKEEVYVYGSFLQSKMFAAGVNCLDCHDKHTMKLKVEGNGLCLQCHSDEVFNVKSHHQHEENSTGAQCVNCHMPQNRYMGVDDRRDHSFKIPRPDLSEAFDTPNACIKCHENQSSQLSLSNQWASDNLTKWHGKPRVLLASKTSLMMLNSGQAISLEQHLAIIADEQLAIISRASALEMLGYTTQSITAEILTPYLTHTEALLRLSAARVATLLAPEIRARHVSPLLKDEFKAIRLAAARSLVSSDISALYQPLFIKAFNEILNVNDINSWRGEGRANQGLLAIEQNDLLSAEKSFKDAIRIDPYFDAGYINLADLYRIQQKPALVSAVLMQGIIKAPLSGVLNYSFGLHLVRQKQLEKSIGYFEKAMSLTPINPQYAYTYVLAIDGIGKSQQALSQLKTLILTYQDKSQLKELGLYLSQKLASQPDYRWFTQF